MAEAGLQNNLADPNKTKIYIRGYSKKAFKLTLEKDMQVADIKRIIKEKMNVSEDNQLLFWKGKQLKNNQCPQFKPLSIVHVVNKKRIILNQITLFIKKIENSPEVFTFTVSPQMKIEDFCEKLLPSVCEQLEDCFLVYTGKRLNPKKNFIEEMIEDESEILLVRKTKIIDHAENKLAERNIKSKSVQKRKSKKNENVKKRELKNPQKITLEVPVQVQTAHSQFSRGKSIEVELSNANAQHSIPSSVTAERKPADDEESKSNEPEIGNEQNNQEMLEEIANNHHGKLHRAYSETHFTKFETPVEFVQVHKHEQIKEEPFEEEHQKQKQEIYEISVYDLLSGKQPHPVAPSHEHIQIKEKDPEQIAETHSEIVEKKYEQNLSAELHNNQQDAPQVIRKGQNSSDFEQIMAQRVLQKQRHSPPTFMEKVEIGRQIVKKYEDGEQIRQLKVDHIEKPIRKMNVFNPHQCQKTEQLAPNSHQYSQQQSRKIHREPSSSANLQESQETDDHVFSSIRAKSNGFHFESGLDETQEKNAEMNEEEYTFIEKNRNWSAQLDHNENTKFEKIDAGGNVEAWKKVDLPFMDMDAGNYQRILEESRPAIGLNETPTGIFNEPSNHDLSH